jgi:hypothetical protein
MEGGVVEADRAVIEGIAVFPEDDEKTPQSTELVKKDDMPPKVAPGDQPPASVDRTDRKSDL